MLNIALNTFKEIIRNKFLYLIVIFALLFIIFSISLWKLTIWEQDKVIVDFWIAMIEIFGVIWVLFVWSQLLFKEIEWKTIFLILSKPIRRYDFILWKFIGFSMILFLIWFLQSSLYIWVLFFKSISIDLLILMSLLFILFKLLIFIAFVLLLSTFMSTILTILISFMVYLIWHSFSLIIDLVKKMQNETLLIITKFLRWIFPPFEALNFKDRIWIFTLPSYSEYFFSFVNFFIYLIFILLLAIIIFNNKKFEN